MRKIYALVAGMLLSLAFVNHVNAQPSTPDAGNFNFSVNVSTNNVDFTNSSALGTEPGNRIAFWSFGDGAGQYTGALDGIQHHYTTAGSYNVCLKIYRFRPTSNDSVLSAVICKTVIIEVNCRAEFSVLSSTSNSLGRYFVAQPFNNQNKRPVYICWSFGDGKDTCIQYPSNTTLNYAVYHLYAQAGNYTVCVKVVYDGGCEASKCNNILIVRPDSCGANFETVPTTGASALRVYFRAIPQHNNNKKPTRICWKFGDGTDTCINYLNLFNGAYVVAHNYQRPGIYDVCVNISYVGGCDAGKCMNVKVGNPDTCYADFEKILSPTADPLRAYFRASPKHNNNQLPSRICWKFGDGKDTCINYSPGTTNQYVVAHNYAQPGQYEVCVDILYAGGCEAVKCNKISIVKPDTCASDFVRIQSSTANPLQAYFQALPKHNNNQPPSKICWKFGDGKDTCINYSPNLTYPYVVAHRYSQPGQYEVCVDILYLGGCEAKKCNTITIVRPDTCAANFEIIPTTGPSALRIYFRALPKHNNNQLPSRICWKFGDGKDTCINYSPGTTNQYVVAHNYTQPGQYEVCVDILYVGGCETKKCNTITIVRPDTCGADFERILSPTADPLRAYFRASPKHNNNQLPSRICWKFGDGKDTCINYSPGTTNQYVVAHNYAQAGQYEVCVDILYLGGCEAVKCNKISIVKPDTCAADFVRIQSSTTNPLQAYFQALPKHNNNQPPSKICWKFGDGTDTCINYSPNLTYPYVVAHRYSQPGQYEVCVDILYLGGCEAKKCNIIVIPPVPITCRVQLFEITPSVTSLVRGFLATPSATPPSKPEMVCWYFGDGKDTCIKIDPLQPIPDLSIRHQYPGPGVYKACVKVLFQGGCVAENCVEVTIRSITNLCGGYISDRETGPRTYSFKGFSIHAPNDDAVSYNWTFGDGSSAIGQEVTHTYNQAGNYRVCLVINTRLGCETRICKSLYQPGTNQPVLILTPNPVVNVLSVDFLSTHTEQVNIRILNSNGTPVRTAVQNATAGHNNWTFDLSGLMPGVYSFIVQSPNQLASAIFIKI